MKNLILATIEYWRTARYIGYPVYHNKILKLIKFQLLNNFEVSFFKGTCNSRFLPIG